MQWIQKSSLWLGAALVALSVTGCGTVSTLGKLEDGAGTEAMKMWDRWIEADGDIAVATTWERKVKPGLTAAEVEQIIKMVQKLFSLK
jgi:hypothetical protein